MYQIDNSTAVAAIPASTALGTNGFFTDGNPATGVPATIMPAEFMNMLMMENLNVLTAAGIAPVKNQFNQLALAIAKIVQNGAAGAASETSAGILKLATSALAAAGADNTTAITPQKLAAQIQAGGLAFGVDTGTANTYVCTFSPALTARVEGQVLRFKVKTTSTGACTINDGLGVVPMVGGAHAALQYGELLANGDAWIQWNTSVGSGSYILLFCTGAPEQVAPATQTGHAVTAGQLQTQALTAFTTAGTAPAFTLTPTPAITAYATNQRFQVTFNASGTTPTLNVSGIGVKNLKQYNSIGTKIAATVINGQVSDVVYDGTDFVVLDQLPNASGTTAAQFDNSTSLATTAFVQGVGFQFSGVFTPTVNTTLTAATHAGSVIIASSASLITITLPAATTMPSRTAIKLWSYGAGGMTVAAAGSDGIYLPSLVTTVSIPTGAWITLVSNGTNGWFAVDMSGVGVGQAYQVMGGARVSGTTYTNSTGKPIWVAVWAVAAASGSLNLTVNGIQVSQYSTNNTTSGANGTVCAIVPNGATYSVTAGAAAISTWAELR